MHAIQHTVIRNFWPMALEKPTREKPVRERDFIIRKFIANLRNFQTNLSQPGRENFCLVFHAKQKKSNSDYFSIFCLNFRAVVRTIPYEPRNPCPKKNL